MPRKSFRGPVSVVLLAHNQAEVIVAEDGSTDGTREILAQLGCLRSVGAPSCGRFAEFEYVNMDQVIERAMKLAGQLNQDWPSEKTS